MTQLVVLAHGMGDHDPTWGNQAVQIIKQSATKYGLPDQFSEKVEEGKIALVPICYDGEFTRWATAWGRNTRTMLDFVRTNSIAVPANILSWMENADKAEDNFIWSHVVDVILYRFFPLITAPTRVQYLEELTKHWAAVRKIDPNAPVHIVAHSLGTSVTHDSLALLGGPNPPPKCEGFSAANARIANLFMCANVSKVLDSSGRVYDSIVCPSSQRTPSNVGNYINVRHELDPFPMVDAFRPQWTTSDFIQVETEAVREFNTHSFERYLADPRVHTLLLRALFGFDSISKAVALGAIAKYDAEPGPACPQRLRDFIQHSRQRIEIIRQSRDIRTMLLHGVQFLVDAQETQKQCAS